MKYHISKINRTIELNDKLVKEFTKYDELRDSIFTILLRSKYKNKLSETDISDKELSSVCNEILLTELKAIADMPAAIETYMNNIGLFKKGTDIEIMEVTQMSKSLDTKTANVYILTKTGSYYSEEGKQYLIDNMSEKYSITDFVFLEGKSYNNPEILIKSLKNNINPYVVLSMNPITILYDSNIESVIKILNDNKDRSAWETLSNICKSF